MLAADKPCLASLATVLELTGSPVPMKVRMTSVRISQSREEGSRWESEICKTFTFSAFRGSVCLNLPRKET